MIDRDTKAHIYIVALPYRYCMSDESTSLTRRTDTMTNSTESGEFMLSEDEQELISELHQETGYYRTPTAESETEVIDLATIDAVKARTLDTHSRIIIDVEDEKYTLQMFDGPTEPYERRYLAHVLLNGKQIEVRDGGLELFDVSITLYRTHNGEYIASIWS